MKATKRRPAKTRSPERTKARLLQAAKKLFARTGLHGVSVSEIARESGVSAAMINHHFGGKEGLYRACVAGFGEAQLAALTRLVLAANTHEELAVRLQLIVIVFLL